MCCASAALPRALLPSLASLPEGKGRAIVQELTRQPVEHGALFCGEFLRQSRGRFEKRLRIGKVLKALRAPASWIRGGTELLVQQVNEADNPELHIF